MLAEADTLHTIAQIAITLIGFSGIVIIFGNRSAAQWTAEESLRFFALIAPTLVVLFCSFVPILLSYLVRDSEAMWRASNAVLGLAHAANITVFFINPRRAKVTTGQKINGLIGLLTILAHLLAAAGLLQWYVPIFIFGLLQQTWIGVHNFLLLFGHRNDAAT